MTTPIAKPLLKWVGGKTRILPDLVARVPEKFGTYYEPFAGGAALFFRLAPERAVLGDLNADLITTYTAVRDAVDGVIALLEQHRRNHADARGGAAYYYSVRDLWNHPGVTWTAAQRAAAFIYLNKTCFNGLWRVNRDGHFNVPAGKYKNPNICDEVALRAAAVALARASIHAGHYSAITASAKAGDFVYFDPPYDETFTDYTGDGFGPADQEVLATTVRELVERGVKVMLSNNDTPRVRALYDGFNIDVVQCGRAINSNGRGRGAVNEVIVTAGYTPARKFDDVVQAAAVVGG